MSSNEGRWVRLSFGVLRLARPSTVKFCVIETTQPKYGFYVGDLQLRACGIEWEKERLLLLCFLRQANGKEGACLLQELPREAIGLIAQMLITPAPAEVSSPGSLLRHYRNETRGQGGIGK
jgi:hypothetical protein